MSQIGGEKNKQKCKRWREKLKEDQTKWESIKVKECAILGKIGKCTQT